MKKFLSVLLAVMMVLSTVSFAAPSAMGTFVTVEQEIPAAVETPEAEAELAGGITDKTPHGELIYELNFNDLANGTTIANGTKLSALGATLSSKYASTEKLYLVLSGYKNAVVENGALKAEKTTTSGRWPQIQVSGGNKNSIVDNGIIYMEADMKYDFADAETTTVAFGLTGYREYTDGVNDANGSQHQTSVQTIYTIEENKQYSLSGAYALNDADGINGMECIIFLTTFGADSSVEGNYLYLDNLRLYYKPFEADVTVKCGSQTVTKTYSTTEAVSAADLASLFELDLLEAATGVVVDGVEYGIGDNIYFTEDTTAEVVVEMVDPKYYDAEYGLQLFNFDFEAATIGDQIPDGDTTPITLTDAYKTPFTDKLFAHPAEKWMVMANTGKTFVMADPKNPDNKVLGTENITSAGYPVIRVDSWVDWHKSHIWGFVESEEGYYTVVYDVMDTNGALDFTDRFGGITLNKPNEGGWYDEAEDTPAEYRTTKVAGEYRTNVSKYGPEKLSNLTSTKEVSYVKIHSKAPNANSYYVDNIRLYWKPLTADITVSANGMEDVTISNPTLTNLDTQGMTVSALLEQAGVDYSEVSDLSYSFKGVSLAPEGGKVYGLNDTIGFVGDGTVYLIFEEVDMTDWIDENGIVVMEMDFENVPDNTIANRAKISSFGGRVNPYFAHSDEWAIDLSGLASTATVVNDAEKGKVLELTYTTTGSRSWPQFLFGYMDNDKGLDTIIKDSGTFVISVDFKADFETAANYAGINIATNGYKDGAHQGPNNIMTFTGLYTSGGTLVDNTWYSIEGANGPANAGIDGPTKFTFVLEHGAGNTAGTVTKFYIDNLKVCWKPDTVDVTVNGGKNTAFETVTLKDVSTSATIDEIIAMIPGATAEYGKITGLADMNGNKLTSFGAASNVEYQAVWTPWTVMAGSADFAVDSKTGWSNATGGWAVSMGAEADMGNGGGDLTTAGLWIYNNGMETKNGNLYKYVKTPKMGDEKNGTLTAPTPWSIPAVRTVDGRGNIREEITTSLAAGNDAEYILVKYRYLGIPDLAQVAKDCTNPDGYKYSVSSDGLTLTYKDRNGDTATATLAPAYGTKYYVQRPSGNYSYGGGEEFHKNEAMVEGEWYYDFLPVDANIKGEGASKLVVQHTNLFDGMTIEYDYVNFVKLGVEDEPIKPEPPTPDGPKYTPATSDETGYRTDAPNGIRFKADLDDETATDASDYGWVVGRAAKGANEETLVIGAESTITAYGRENGVDLKNFYNEAEKIFTAVVYNIPSNMADDVICVKPFAIVDGTTYYGEMISKTPREIATAHGIDVSELLKK